MKFDDNFDNFVDESFDNKSIDLVDDNLLMAILMKNLMVCR